MHICLQTRGKWHFRKCFTSIREFELVNSSVQNTPKKMASGGLPPQQTMPPPRGRTPGPTSDVAQIHSDEEVARMMWEVSQKGRCKTNISGLENWCFDTNFLEKYLVNKYLSLL